MSRWTRLLKTSKAQLSATFRRLDRQHFDAASELVANRALARPLSVAQIARALILGRQPCDEIIRAHDMRLLPRAQDTRRTGETE